MCVGTFFANVINYIWFMKPGLAGCTFNRKQDVVKANDELVGGASNE